MAINNKTKKDLNNRNIFIEIARRIGLNISENKSKTKNLSQLYINSKTLANFIRKELFISEKGKDKIFNSNLFFQNKENLLGLYNGLMLSDGHFSKNIDRDSFDNTSPSIIGAFKILSSILEKPIVSIHKRLPFWSGKYLCKTSYKLKICHAAETMPKSKERCFSDKNFWYMPIQNITIIKKKKNIVYDLSILGKHSYVINNCVVHNSAPSFYTSKLLGLTTIDRISASVKLFPERFISAERLIEAKSLPDIDLNLGTPEIFAKAQEEVLGCGHSYQMIAFGTLRSLGAWKLYARVENVPFDVANLVSEQIQQYELDLKHADDEEEKEELDIHNYIDPHYHNIYDESKKYLGLVNNIVPHPCAYLIFSQGKIEEEFGLIKIKTGDVEHICVVCDGHFAEDYKLLKNDLLKVSVVDLIYRVYKRIGIEPHPLPELIKLCENDQTVWKIYKDACTMGINQFEQTGSSGRGAKYAPKNISEISAFVAAIRPGFKSNYKQFEAREHFEYGIKSR